MRYITDSNGYLLEVSFGAVIQCGGKGCTEYTGGVPSGYSSLVDWFAKEGDKLYRWKIAGGQLTLDSSVPVKSEPGPMFARAGYGYGEKLVSIGEASDDTAFCAKLNELFNAMGGDSHTKQILFSYYGYDFIGTLYNPQNNYGTLIAYSYIDPNVAWRFKQLVRVRLSGTWQPWVDTSPTSFTPAKTLLWQNASPTSTFADQVIGVGNGEDGYTYYGVEFNSGSYYAIFKRSCGDTSVSKVLANSSGAAMSMQERPLYIGDGAIHFRGGKAKYVSSAETYANDDMFIPYRVYGIKG